MAQGHLEAVPIDLYVVPGGIHVDTSLLDVDTIEFEYALSRLDVVPGELLPGKIELEAGWGELSADVAGFGAGVVEFEAGILAPGVALATVRVLFSDAARAFGAW